MTGPTLLGVSAVSRLLGVSDQTVYRYLESGDIDGFQVGKGKKWRILRSSVEDHLIKVRHNIHILHTRDCSERISVSING